jgi:polyphosphate kinase
MGTSAADDRLINRESSWLDFNQRVLAMAADQNVPLLERVKFLAIFSSNLDEFFEVRVAALHEQHAAFAEEHGGSQTAPGGGVPGGVETDPIGRIAHIGVRVGELVRVQSSILNDLVPRLAAAGINIVAVNKLDAATRSAVSRAFDEGILPVLTPLGVDPGHPFPYISNKSLNLAVVIRDRMGTRFARVKVPPLLPRFVPAGDPQRFVLLEDVISAHIHELFPGFEVVSTHCFRVTRNADLSVADTDVDDLLAAVETELRRRRFGRAVRLEVAADTPDDIVDLLQSELELTESDVTRISGPLDLTSMWALHRLPRLDLKDEPWPAFTSAAFGSSEQVDMFEAIRNADILVHHPYESFATSVEAFIRQAAHDPSVLTIKMTLYRTSGNSPIAQALIEAAELGKQVAVLIELKARFDEQANITWARAMEEVGIHVAYGVVGLKTHCKVALVVRAEAQGLRRYCHLATGNYNSSTAKLYEDFGLFTADPLVGSDLTKLFNTLTGFGRTVEFDRLLVAPQSLRRRVIEFIRNERSTPDRGPGRILMKLNALVDAEIIEELYAASQAGVEVDLVIRGICCLRPGVAGLSDRIRVRSVIGRYLEHSRLFYFANGDGDGLPTWLIGSADMMPRNLDRRVETLVPITQPNLIADLNRVVDQLLDPDAAVWELGPDGSWRSHGSQDPQRNRYDAITRRKRARL